jgi:hypothetical protein
MPADLTKVLESINGILQLATLAEGVAVPLIAGIVKDVKASVNRNEGSVEYTVVISVGQEEAQAAVDSFTSALKRINDEREKDGLPPLDIPGQQK